MLIVASEIINTKPLNKEDVKIGIEVSFIGRDENKEITKLRGIVVKLNPKRTKIRVGTGLVYSVPYNLLSTV